jgi:hypothetical protein
VIIDALKWCQKIGTEADLGDYDEFVADRQLHIPKTLHRGAQRRRARE